MTIICLEGTSAVGKSTTCREFSTKYGAYIVEESHFLFGQTTLQGMDLVIWHLECQVKRWQIAREKSNEYEYVLLDGDIFKLWYDWVYGLDESLFYYESEYFRRKIISKEVAFPHTYVVLWADEANLKSRKESDTTRSRRNFIKHLQLVKPQIKFFEALNTLIPNYVSVFEAKTIEGNVLNIVRQTQHSPSIEGNELLLFDFMIDFLKTNKS